MSVKQLGYILLSGGIMIILFSGVFLFLVYTGKREPVGLFNISAPTIPLDAFIPKLPEMPGISLSIPQTGKNIEILPTAAFNKLLNMGVTLMLSGFFVNIGFKISSIGTQLLTNHKQEKPKDPPAQAAS